MNVDNRISLFVMKGCQVCPQMERLLKQMQLAGKLKGLEIFDLSEHPELAQKHNIRSVPYYLINGVAFTGLKTAAEIDRLLSQAESRNWSDRLVEDFKRGDLADAEALIREHPAARSAMLLLLENPETELVVRIGLTAVIEIIATTNLLTDLDSEFIKLADSGEQRIAVDALYYLRLIGTTSCIEKLHEVAQGDKVMLAAEASDLLAELSAALH